MRLGYKGGERQEQDCINPVPIHFDQKDFEGKVKDACWDEGAGRLCVLFGSAALSEQDVEPYAHCLISEDDTIERKNLVQGFVCWTSENQGWN